MRERLSFLEPYPSPHRITPAYAGKTKMEILQIRLAEDHPRLSRNELEFPSLWITPAYAGKTQIKIFDGWNNLGSPPRMRERQISMSSLFATMRITPAYAGKTLCGVLNCRPGRDHPRVCGKDPRSEHSYALYPGSPPRMRERPQRRIPETKHSRITPAYAGKTGQTGR